MKFNYIIIILAMVGTASLYLLSILAQPAVISLSEISVHDGKLAIVKGIVISSYQTQTGKQVITIQDETTTEGATATLFVEEITAVEYGDSIQATGKVQKYKNEWQVVVENSHAIHIVQKWRNITIPLEYLSTYHQQYRNVNIAVCGVVDVMEPASLVLRNQDSSCFLFVVFDVPALGAVSTGETVSVSGTFLYDEATFRYVLSACSVDSCSSLS